MRIAGIIAEYDPFHKGHAAHIAATRAENGGNATHVVTVISGNFTQRGEPALISKFHRAEMALANGSDLVLEMPTPWAMSPAECFANGGVSLLHALGCVDMLSFGSECGHIPTLEQLAHLADTPSYSEALQRALTAGIPYAAAGQAAATELVGKHVAAQLSHPNNTLGVEYIRASTHLGANWRFFTLQRQGALHNEKAATGGIASASWIRHLVREGQIADATEYMPYEAAQHLLSAAQEGKIAVCTEKLEAALLARLRCMRETDFARLPWLSEGIENRLYRASRTAATYDDLLAKVKTRRYPLARLRRILWSALLDISAEDCHGVPPYIRVLGMNQRGRDILSAASPTLPILTRTAQLKELNERCQRIFALECVATDLHALCTTNPDPCSTDHTKKFIVK